LGPKHSLIDLSFGLNIGTKLDDWFGKLGGLFSLMGTTKNEREHHEKPMPKLKATNIGCGPFHQPALQ
jgi:hypothetical protein